MERDATSAFLTELAKSKNQPVHLVQIALESATVYMTDAWRSITYDGHDYTALGHILGFSDIEETARLQVSDVSIVLTGVDQTYISEFLNYDYIDRTAKIYKAFLDDDMALVANPVLIFEGRLDQPVIDEDPDQGSCNCSIKASNHWTDFERRPGRRTNHEEQQIHYSGDKGFEYASEVVTEIRWGRAP